MLDNKIKEIVVLLGGERDRSQGGINVAARATVDPDES
jgi:hypothetical protein